MGCIHEEWIRELVEWNDGVETGELVSGMGVLEEVKRLEVRWCPWCGERVEDEVLL